MKMRYAATRQRINQKQKITFGACLSMEEKQTETGQAFIDGEWVSSTSRDVFLVHNPATGELISHVAECTESDLNAAVAAANRSFHDWSGRPAKERSAILQRVAELMEENADELGRIITRESGKPLREAVGEIRYGASYFRWFAAEAVRAYGDVIPSNSRTNRFIVTKHAIGVCAMITPWNFPSAMLARKTAAALAAGCTIVAKPAEDTPLSALALANMLEQAGTPNGVFNVVTSSRPREFGSLITEHKGIHKISFTGSTLVGRLLFAQSAITLKKLSLELGGNAPFLVFDDADVDAAIDGLMASKFRNAGQTCICTNRVYVHSSILDEFGSTLAKRVAALTVGPGEEESSDIGPLVNKRAFDKVSSLVSNAEAEGAKILTGGCPDSRGGLFYSPTVLGDVSQRMQITKNEIFGPVVTLIPFGSDEEAVELANDTEFGLAAYMYTQDIKRAWQVSEVLEYGMVGINDTALSNAEIPFGGIKQSGHGREGSKYGLEDYLETKFRLFGGL